MLVTKIEVLKSIKLNAFSVYDDSYIKVQIRTYGNKINTNFRGLNVPEYIECECFTVISIDSLVVYDKKLLRSSIFRQLSS